MKAGGGGGGKGGKIIFVTGVVFATIMAVFGYMAAVANNYVIVPP